MKRKEKQFSSGRRKAVKIIGLSSAALVTGGLNNTAFSQQVQGTVTGPQDKTGPDDLPNQPFGEPKGINPGRVVWAWDPKATNENCTDDYQTGDFHFKPENYDQATVSRMFTESIQKLTGAKTAAESWDAMFKYFNRSKHQVERGYTPGEKIFIKINQTSSRGRLNEAIRKEGKYYYLPFAGSTAAAPAPAAANVPANAQNFAQGDAPANANAAAARRPNRVQASCCETTPPVTLEILRQLINVCGVKQSDIAVGDPQNPLWGHNYDAWAAEFPDVVYTDNMFANAGRTLINRTTEPLLFYADKSQTDVTYDVVKNANYMINVPNLKPHAGAGITLTAKNHFGTQGRPRADHFHYTHPTKVKGYKQYRVLVDLMGSKYLGQNTLLFVVDGLWGGGSGEVGPPVKYFMAPFNNNWSNSLFISQDEIALQSVCFDFLRTEWDGVNKHNPMNNRSEATPNVNGVDDFLHQGADPSVWPAGIVYDPDNSGKPISSLGVHEHWNNATDKQYSRNLGIGNGIELVSIPETLVKNKT